MGGGLRGCRLPTLLGVFGSYRLRQWSLASYDPRAIAEDRRRVLFVLENLTVDHGTRSGDCSEDPSLPSSLVGGISLALF